MNLITTPIAREVGLEDISLTMHRRGTAEGSLPSVNELYGTVYAEPPYREGPQDVADFVKDWPWRLKQPDFRLVLAWRGGSLVGLAFGYELEVDTTWWDGLRDHAPVELTQEHKGRTFAIIELAVRRPFRRRGIAQELHTHLVVGLPHERVTLLVRPEADPAQRAYQSWGYQCVGQIQPFIGGPTYHAMLLEPAAPPEL
jgi:ribosomal protein S18 acetylase RimI-like enzyme